MLAQLLSKTPWNRQRHKKAHTADFPTLPFNGLLDEVLTQVNLFGVGEKEVDTHDDIYEARTFADEEAEE